MVALKGDAGDVVERPAALFGAGELGKPEAALVGDRPVGRLLAAPAHPGPAPVERSAALHVATSLLPGAQERLRLDPPDEVGGGGTGAVKAGGLVTFIGVAVDVDDVLAAGHLALAADRRLGQMGRGAVMVLVVI